jgi:hypothetical protein
VNTSFAPIRRRAQALAAAVLVLANVIAVTAFLHRPEPDVRRAIETAATPSWRVETGWEKPDAAEPGRGVTDVAGVSAPAPLDEAEIVTPEQLRAASRSPCSPDPSSWVDVRQHGAKGNGRADDTAAIQKANDAVAKNGGGRVVFSPGIYRVMGVQQDSCVEFTSSGGAELKHLDGTTSTSIIESRVRSTTGSIAANSRVLNVRSAAGMRPGAIIAIQAAGGRSAVQRTKLQGNLTPYMTTVSLRDTTGFQRGWRNYLYIEKEVISYDGINGNTLMNVERGLFGTQQTHHKADRIVAQAQRLYAVVVRTSGRRITLDRVSGFRTEGVDVKVGGIGMSTTGLTLNGRRKAGGSGQTSPVLLRYQLARFAAVRASTLRNGQHGGITFEMGTSDSFIEGNTLTDNTDPWHYSGSAIWLFRGAMRNVIKANTIAGLTFTGITIDDRTVHSSEYDAESQRNTVDGNTIDIPMFKPSRNAGVVIIGSRHCEVINNVFRNAKTGVMVARSRQAPLPSVARSNTVRDNILIGHRVGFNVSGSDNDFVGNEIRQVQTPWSNSGHDNRFVDNSVE